MALIKVYEWDFYSNLGSRYKIELHQEGGTPITSGLALSSDGFIMSSKADEDNRFSPIIGTEVEIPILIEDAAAELFINGIVINQEKNSFIKIYAWNGTTWDIFWRGIVLQDLTSFEDAYYPYQHTIRATDGLARLKGIEFSNAGNPYTSEVSLIVMLRILLTKAGTFGLYGVTDNYISTCVNFMESNADSGDIMSNMRVMHEAFYTIDSNGVSFLDSYEVLKQICSRFGLRCYQENGSYHFVSVTNFELITNQTFYHYGTGTNLLGTESKKVILENIKWNKSAGSNFTLYPSLNRVLVKYKYRQSHWPQSLIPTFPPYTAANYSTITANADTKLRVRYSAQVNYLHNGTNPSTFYARVQVKVNVGSYYLVTDGFNVFWSTTIGGYITYLYAETTGFTADVTSSNFVQIDLITPVLPSSGLLGFDAVNVSYVDINGNSFTLPSGSSTTLTQVEAQIMLYDADFAEGVKETEAINTISGTPTENSSEYETTELILGDAQHSIDVGRIQIYNGSNWVNSSEWDVGTEYGGLSIDELLANEIISGQRTPTRWNDLQAFLLKNTTFAAATNPVTLALYDDASIFVPLSVTYNAGSDDITGTWFTSAVVRTFISNQEAVVVDPAVGQLPSGIGRTTDIKTFKTFSLTKITTVSTPIAAGTVTSIPITAIGDAIVSKGDILQLVNPATGESESVTVSANQEAADTSISVNSVTLANSYGIGSFLTYTGAKQVRKASNTRLTTQTLTTDGSIGVFDVTILNGAGSTVAASLPRAADAKNKTFTIKCISSTFACSIASVDSIEGQSSIGLRKGEVLKVYSNGTTWQIIAAIQRTQSVKFISDAAYDEEIDPAEMRWNSEDGTVEIGMGYDDVVQQVGLEIYYRVKNQTGNRILNGTVVMYDGSVGASGIIKAKPADSTLAAFPSAILGVATMDINNGEDGFVTHFGLVRQINTSAFVDGDVLYWNPAVTGGLTATRPTAPDPAIIVAAVVVAAANGTILVRPDAGKYLHDLHDVAMYDPDTLAHNSLQIWDAGTKTWTAVEPDDSPYVPFTVINDANDYTGWIDGDNITVSYDHTQRKITLSGDLSYMYKGKKTVLSSPWTSDAHAATNGSWFLSTDDGTNFTWSQTMWDFTHVMAAYVYYMPDAVDSFGIREPHGLMDYESHEEFHSQIGTYRVTGGQVTAGTYAFDSAVDADITPGFDAAVIKDEDVSTSIPAWVQGTYTVMYVGASESSVFSTTESFPFLASATFIYVNDPATGSLSAGVTNRYYNVYQVMMPVTSDSDSQKYRMFMIQPQREHLSLAAATAEDVRSLNLGSLVNLSPEFTVYTRITYYTNNSYTTIGKVRIPTGGITYNVGNRAGQVSVSRLSSNNHSVLSNLNWADSGHIGTASRVAAFDASGNATYLDYADWDTAYNKILSSASFSTTTGVITLTLADSSTVTVDIDGRFILLSEKGAANGVATLDSSGKLPASQLPTSVLTYLGTWDASTNTPTLADGTGTSGNFYIVSVAGTQDLGSGNITFAAGDWVVYNGSIWEKSVNSSAVTSVNGFTGAVVLTTTDIAEGTNLYYTEARVSANTDVAANTAARHTHSNKTVLDGIDATDVSNWDSAYDKKITSASFSTTTGVLTLNTQDSSTITASLDGRYYLASNPSGFTSNTGTVTSVAMTVPTGLTVSGSPITTSGTLAVSLTAGYVIPTTTEQSNWTTSYNSIITNVAFGTTTGILTLTKASGATLTASLDGRYLTSFTETDPIYTASSWYTTTNNATNWDTAYGWGNWATGVNKTFIDALNVDADTLDGLDSSYFYPASNPNGYTTNIGTVTSVAVTVPIGLSVSGSPITTNGTIAIGLQTGYTIPATALQSVWSTAYNNMITAASFSTSTGVLTLTQQDLGTITVDLDGRYLESFTETDPIYTASSWYTTTNNAANWDTAYGWGDHASAGYLTTETDPIYTASSWYTTTNNATNWDTAYGWGDHATAGYLTSFTELDPVFSASDAAGITSTDITNWDTAYSWGDHAGLYDLLGAASTAVSGHESTYNHSNYNTAYSWGNHASAGYLTTETDPIFVASDAYSITATQITNWDTAYSWGDHAGLYDLSGAASTAVGTHESTYNHTNYNTAYSWGNHASAGYMVATSYPDLTAIEALTGTGLLRRTAVNTWALDGSANLGIHTFILDVSRSESALVGTSDFYTLHMPYDFKITSVMASVTERPLGQAILIDITDNATSIFNTVLSIDDGGYSSYSSANPYDLASDTITADHQVVIDVTQVGTTQRGAGLKVYICGYKA